MSENEEKKVKKLCINPTLVSTVFILTFVFYVFYFVIGFDNIGSFFIAVFFALIKFWYIPILILSFTVGAHLSQSFEDKYENSGYILFYGSCIIVLILFLYGIWELYNFKIEDALQKQSKIEIIQPEKK